ncbi:DUF3363 domain-containing protein [Caulobacter sp. AP07]|uniref:DUF3363 domain-containing protein n=1 Tax=Caulobacter sp. AP07 TaxID=1144304 RepID=UPI0009D9C91D|nr:DUF3363 domain-containing protein [Caulobacter sp. AP07]
MPGGAVAHGRGPPWCHARPGPGADPAAAAFGGRRQWRGPDQRGDERHLGAQQHRTRRDLIVTAEGIARETGLAFSEARPGQRIEGVYRRPVELASGRFAVIERSRDFTLVPWKLALESQEGRVVSGVLREAGVSWTIGRGRGGPSPS